MNNIEKIHQEIERRLKYTHDWLRGDEKRHPKQTAISKNYYKMKGDERTLDALLAFIDSLPDESKVDVTDFCKPIDPGIAQCIADNWWEMLGEEEKPSEDFPTSDEEMAKFLATHPKVEVPEKYKTPNWLFDKQPSEDLEEAAARYERENRQSILSSVDIVDAFIAGAEWQARQLLKGSPLPEDTVLFLKGVEEGKRLMMEDAARRK